MKKILCVVLFALSAGCMFAADAKLAANIEKAGAGDETAKRAVREAGREAIKPLRATTLKDEKAQTEIRGVLTDLAVEVSKIDKEDGTLLHELGREEGKARRYGNAERLYERAQQIFDSLRADAKTRGDKSKARDFEDERKICDEMKDKARKLAGKATGVNLGFVRIGKEVDLSDDWK